MTNRYLKWLTDDEGVTQPETITVHTYHESYTFQAAWFDYGVKDGFFWVRQDGNTHYFPAHKIEEVLVKAGDDGKE